MKNSKNNFFSHFGHKYNSLNDSKINDSVNNNNNNQTQMTLSLGGKAEEIAYLAGFYALQYENLNEKTIHAENDCSIKVYMEDGFYNDEILLFPFDQTTPFSLTRALIAPQNLSIDEQLFARKKIISSNILVRHFYDYTGKNVTQLTYDAAVNVIVPIFAMPQFKHHELESILHFIVTPPSYVRTPTNLDSVFAKTYLNAAKFPDYQDVIDCLGENDLSDDFCFIKNEMGEYFSCIQNEEGKAELAWTKDKTNAFILHKKACQAAIVQDITNAILVFEHRVDQDNQKDFKNKNCVSQFFNTFIVNNKRSGWLKVTLDGMGTFTNFLSKTSAVLEMYPLFFQAALQAIRALPTQQAPSRIIEFPLFEAPAIEAFKQVFNEDVIKELNVKNILIIEGKSRDNFDFRPLNTSQYIYGYTDSENGNSSVKVNPSTMLQDGLWVFNFMKMLSPYNQFFVSIKDGVAIYQSVAERYQSVAKEFNVINTKEKCQGLFSIFVNGVKAFMVHQLVELKWSEHDARNKVDEWYNETSFEEVKQNHIYESTSLHENTLWLTLVARNSLESLKQFRIPMFTTEEFDLAQVDPSYGTSNTNIVSSSTSTSTLQPSNTVASEEDLNSPFSTNFFGQ